MDLLAVGGGHARRALPRRSVARWHQITPSAGAGGTSFHRSATGIFLIGEPEAHTLSRRWSEHFDLSQGLLNERAKIQKTIAPSVWINTVLVVL
jgi:hypothetical protein